MTLEEKVRENRLRRMAERRGLVLTRSRRRDPLALDYGLYRLLRAKRVLLETKSLDAIEARLLKGE